MQRGINLISYQFEGIRLCNAAFKDPELPYLVIPLTQLKRIGYSVRYRNSDIDLIQHSRGSCPWDMMALRVGDGA